MKNRNQYSDTPKNQDDGDLVDPNVWVINNDPDHWDTVTNPPSNPQIEMDFSNDRVRVMDDSGGQTSLKIMFDKQTPEEVKRGMLSQALLASMGSIDSG